MSLDRSSSYMLGTELSWETLWEKRPYYMVIGKHDGQRKDQVE